jgi:ADP-ribose pyrophosphatase
MTGRAHRLARYLALAAKHPEQFATPPGGAVVALDPDGIAAIEATVGDRLEARGLPRDWATVGVHYEDPYLFLMRDAITYADGTRVIHHRIARPGFGDRSGAAVLPVMEGRVLLLRHFRHATRSWQLEIPRGMIEPGATAAETAVTELAEEMGAVATSVVHLAPMHTSTALSGAAVELFHATVSSIGAPQASEGIAGIEALPVPELEAMIRDGRITDACTLGAVLHARLRGLL